MGATYNLARTAQLGAPILVGWAVAAHGLAGGLSLPLGLALATAAWAWTLPETRGIAPPRLDARHTNAPRGSFPGALLSRRVRPRLD